MNAQKIFLIGLMGTGKSKVARILSDLLQIEAIDTDNFIENKEGMSVQNIFEQKGESYFRNVENEALKEIVSLNKPLIVATGGGLPCFLNNMELMLASGMVFYLKTSPDTLSIRLEHADKERPLLKNASREGIKKILIDLLDKRKSFYDRAHFTINAELSAEAVAALIKRELS